MRKYTVIKDYHACYPDPILLKKGDEVFFGKEDTQYPNWVFCKSIISQKEGWVPKQILSAPNDVSAKAIVLQDYSAYELTVRKGEVLVGLKQLNNWTYCKTLTEEHGWIPSNYLCQISKDNC